MKEVMFIHGMFMNPKSWNNWVTYFSDKGYHCSAPAWPYHNGSPSDLRKHIDPKLGKLTLGQVVESMASHINTLPEKPIIIGHSMGALAAQLLIARNLGKAAICIDSAPPKNISSFKLSYLISNLPIINKLGFNRPFKPSKMWFHYAFCNTMTKEKSDEFYGKFAVPESRNVARTSAGKDGYINFQNTHAPMLFIAGQKDHIIPSSLNSSNFEAYDDPVSQLFFKEFPNRSHMICAQDNWQEVADYIITWLNGLQLN